MTPFDGPVVPEVKMIAAVSEYRCRGGSVIVGLAASSCPRSMIRARQATGRASRPIDDDRRNIVTDIVEIERVEYGGVDNQHRARDLGQQLPQQRAAMLRVDRHLDRTRERSAQPGPDAVRLVAQHRRDKIAGSDADRDEGARPAGHRVEQRAVRPTLPGFDILDDDRVGQFTRVREQGIGREHLLAQAVVMLLGPRHH